ncbi:hypothetical protein SSX86_014747 [Deinandra increscens subsp. villosa]|uniref:Peptidase A1 domain-containing protein n=1 Tax=Deinandra increscens subsp. villosa TaxID=3103831 RepID=A0AAP0DA25_9ASTR
MGFGCNLILVLIFVGSRLIDGFGTFGFDIHHRYSDRVKGVLDVGGHNLPEMGSVEFYSAMVHRDRIFHRRRLAAYSSITFLDGDETRPLFDDHCGKFQTGSYSDTNGVLGLGIGSMSIPSVLANSGLTADSFSMCFGRDRTGRINFGDKGSSDQGDTPINLDTTTTHEAYSIRMTQIDIGNNVTNVDFTGILATRVSFTYLNDHAYRIITETFDSQTEETRIAYPDPPFEYCYDLSQNQPSFDALNLTMEGGNQFSVAYPFVELTDKATGRNVVCLGILKTKGTNLFGLNFLTGYRLVFDRERNVLGWKASDCYDATESNTLPRSPTGTPIGNPKTSPSNSNNPSQTQPRLGSMASTLSYTHFVLIFSIITNFLMFVLL